MTPRRRALFLTVLASGLALGAPSVAAADASFHSSFGAAGVEGATMTVVHSHADEDGKVTYEYVTYTASMHGAAVDRTTSAAK
ncbi:hypothetical protein A6A08_06400 [Nocardiopsis sp. TSRI0078]|uniref:hypothetical protein n=1 Tax=unclassified Nocardiopsis TaxID=2649073 RepID=UPI00093B2BB5|nr:hypothetical protein [Nocardiopsis sp. TSRI0078]OKI16905.1 hypothetical protein A6A08_06400 [Nocardiopsis sp. TSRI0078]